MQNERPRAPWTSARRREYAGRRPAALRDAAPSYGDPILSGHAPYQRRSLLQGLAHRRHHHAGHHRLRDARRPGGAHHQAAHAGQVHAVVGGDHLRAQGPQEPQVEHCIQGGAHKARRAAADDGAPSVQDRDPLQPRRQQAGQPAHENPGPHADRQVGQGGVGQRQGGEGVRPRHGQHLDNGAQAEKEAQDRPRRGAHHHRPHNDGHLDRGGRDRPDGQIAQRGECQKEDDGHQYRHACDLMDFAVAVHSAVLLLRVFHLVLSSPIVGVRRTNYV